MERRGERGRRRRRRGMLNVLPLHHIELMICFGWMKLDSMRNHYRCSLRMGREKRRKGGGEVKGKFPSY